MGVFGQSAAAAVPPSKVLELSQAMKDSLT
ncbi:hypothetical protein KIPB_016507, partial [Kipferlia bialata]|eukprot:g16507.t1